MASAMKLSSGRIEKILTQSIKQVLVEHGVRTSTRSGNKELTFLIKKIVPAPFVSETDVQRVGTALGQKIAELSQERNKQNLDAGVVRRVSFKKNWTAEFGVPGTLPVETASKPAAKSAQIVIPSTETVEETPKSEPSEVDTAAAESAEMADEGSAVAAEEVIEADKIVAEPEVEAEAEADEVDAEAAAKVEAESEAATAADNIPAAEIAEAPVTEVTPAEDIIDAAAENEDINAVSAPDEAVETPEEVETATEDDITAADIEAESTVADASEAVTSEPTEATSDTDEASDLEDEPSVV